MAVLLDPWSAPTAEPPAPRPGPARWISAFVVGVGAVALQVWPLGTSGPTAAARLLLGALTMVLLAATVRRPAGLLLALVAGGAVMATAVPLEGRAPSCIAFGLSAMAVVTVRPVHRRSSGEPEGAVQLLVIGLVGLGWLWTASLRVAAAGLFAALVVVAVGLVRPSSLAGASRAVERVVQSVARVVELALLALVVVPFVVLPVRVAHGVRSLARRLRPPTTSWSERRVARDDDRRDSAGLWLPVPARRRRSRNLAGVLLVVALVIGVVLARRDDAPTMHVPTAALGGPSTSTAVAAPPFRLSSTAAFGQVPWADQIQTEHEDFGSHYLPRDPQLGYVAGDFSGRFTASRDGARRSYRSSCPGCRTVTVWWFGGSAAWGWLERDEHTVPSELVRRAAADGVDLRIRNMAVPGWTIWQEYGLFRRELTRTDEPPDVAVFYDGFNDAAAGVVEASLRGEIDPSPHTVLDGSRFDQYGRDPKPLAPAGGPTAVGVATARKYLQVVRDIERAAAVRGVQVVVVQQADAFVSASQLEFVRPVTRSDPATVQASDMAQAFDAFERSVAQAVVPARRSVAQEPRPLFVDPAHMNELGAALVAGAVYPRLALSLGLDGN